MIIKRHIHARAAEKSLLHFYFFFRRYAFPSPWFWVSEDFLRQSETDKVFARGSNCFANSEVRSIDSTPPIQPLTLDCRMLSNWTHEVRTQNLGAHADQNSTAFAGLTKEKDSLS